MDYRRVAPSVLFALVLLASAVPAAAQSCADVSFTVSAPQSSAAIGVVFQSSISTSSGTPENPWGSYINATLSVPTGLSALSPASINLSDLLEGSHNWNLNGTAAGSYTMNITLSNTTGFCEKAVSITIIGTTPNIAVSVTDLNTVFANLQSEINVTLVNTGNATASNILVDIGSIGNSVQDSKNQTIQTLGFNQSRTISFKITPTNRQEYVVPVQVKYRDSINTEYSTTQTETFAAIGNILQSPTGFLLIGFGGQPLSFAANVSQTLDAVEATGLILTAESSEDFSPNITLARYSSVVNGTATGLTAPGKYFTVDSSFTDRLKSASVKASYSDSEMSVAGIQESTLGLFRYTPAINVWALLQTAQDTGNNTLEANLTDLNNALLGIFGLKSEPSAGSSSSQRATINAGNSNLVNASAVDTILNITASSTVTPAYFVIAKYAALINGTTSGATAMGKYIKVELDDNTRSKILSSMFRVSYSDAELATANLIESSLKIHRYNETTNAWVELATSVDTINNFVEANVTGFSTFGLFGSPVPAPAQTSSGSGGVSSGGGTPVSKTKAKEPVEPEPTTPSEPSAKPAEPIHPEETSPEPSAEPTATGGIPTGAFLTQNTTAIGIVVIIILAAAGYFFLRRKA